MKKKASEKDSRRDGVEGGLGCSYRGHSTVPWSSVLEVLKYGIGKKIRVTCLKEDDIEHSKETSQN